MSQNDFKAFMDKVMTDEAFAQALSNDPQGALKSIGVEATPEMIEAMQGVDANSIKNLAASFGDDRAAI